MSRFIRRWKLFWRTTLPRSSDITDKFMAIDTRFKWRWVQIEEHYAVLRKNNEARFEYFKRMKGGYP